MIALNLCFVIQVHDLYNLCPVVHSLVNKWFCLWTVQAILWFFYKTFTFFSPCIIYQLEGNIHQDGLRLATILVSSRFTCREQTTAIPSIETFGAISLAASPCPERTLYCFHENMNQEKCLVFCRGITYRQVFVQTGDQGRKVFSWSVSIGVACHSNGMAMFLL